MVVVSCILEITRGLLHISLNAFAVPQAYAITIFSIYIAIFHCKFEIPSRLLQVWLYSVSLMEANATVVLTKEQR
jgi:hypothetical protein